MSHLGYTIKTNPHVVNMANFILDQQPEFFDGKTTYSRSVLADNVAHHAPDIRYIRKEYLHPTRVGSFSHWFDPDTGESINTRDVKLGQIIMAGPHLTTKHNVVMYEALRKRLVASGDNIKDPGDGELHNHLKLVSGALTNHEEWTDASVDKADQHKLANHLESMLTHPNYTNDTKHQSNLRETIKKAYADGSEYYNSRFTQAHGNYDNPGSPSTHNGNILKLFSHVFVDPEVRTRVHGIIDRYEKHEPYIARAFRDQMAHNSHATIPERKETIRLLATDPSKLNIDLSAIDSRGSNDTIERKNQHTARFDSTLRSSTLFHNHAVRNNDLHDIADLAIFAEHHIDTSEGFKHIRNRPLSTVYLNHRGSDELKRNFAEHVADKIRTEHDSKYAELISSGADPVSVLSHNTLGRYMTRDESLMRAHDLLAVRRQSKRI